MLEGKTVNLRVLEKEDLPFFGNWYNNPDFIGEFGWVLQQSKTDWEKWYEKLSADDKFFFIEKKDGTRIGTVAHFLTAGLMEIGYVLIQNERKKGYCTEAAMIMIDYLFLSKSIVRIQARTDVENIASQRVLEKVGFRIEGIVRKSDFSRGEWRDLSLYSILREEWKEPKILTRTT